MRLIGYVRVSTDDQAQGGVSLTLTQPQILKNWCAQHGHTLVAVVQDGEVDADGRARGISAGTLFESRRGGRDVIARLEDGTADGVLVWKQDRAFRDSWDALGIGRWLRRRGLHLCSATESIDLHTHAGWLAFGVAALANEYELGKMRDRGREISSALRERGRVYGQVPFGCVAIDGALFREPQAWEERERIVRMRATLSLRALAKTLKDEGVAPPAGGSAWHVSTLWNILDTHEDLRHLPFHTAHVVPLRKTE